MYVYLVYVKQYVRKMTPYIVSLINGQLFFFYLICTYTGHYLSRSNGKPVILNIPNQFTI